MARPKRLKNVKRLVARKRTKTPGQKPSQTSRRSIGRQTQAQVSAVRGRAQGRKKIEGLIKLYHKDDKLFAEIGPRQLNRDYIVLISIARGIGQGQIAGRHELGLRRRLGLAVPQGRTRTSTSSAATCGSRPSNGSPKSEAVQAGLYRQRAVQPADRHARARRAATWSI